MSVLYREMITLCSEIDTIHVVDLHCQNIEIFNLDGTLDFEVLI